MLTILAALTLFLSSGTAAQTDHDQSTPLITAPVGHGQVFRLLDFLSDDQQTKFTFELQAADGSSKQRSLSIDNDLNAAALSEESGKQIIGYSLEFGQDDYSIGLTYAGRSVKVTMSSDDSGPIEFAFADKGNPVVHFDSVEEFDSAVDLSVAVQNGDRTRESFRGQEKKLFEKATSLRGLLLTFLDK